MKCPLLLAREMSPFNLGYSEHRTTNVSPPDLVRFWSGFVGFGLVSAFTVIGTYHENDFFMIIDCVKEPKITDAVTPRFRLIVLKLFDILTKVRVLRQLRIDVAFKLGSNLCLLPSKVLFQILFKLVCFKDLKVTQTNLPFNFLASA